MSDNDNDIESKIFEAAIPFRDLEEEQMCKEMLDGLSEEQIELAARTSYAYLKASRRPTPPPKNVTIKMALRMARRHLVAEKGNSGRALEKMKATLAFRQENNIDDLRQELCDDKDIINSPVNKGFVVCGYDSENRAIMLRFLEYYESLTDEDSFIKVMLYNIERAIACTERKSLGQQEKYTTAVNHTSMGPAPTLSLLKRVLGTVQNHYPERLHYYIPTDPPFIFYVILKMAMPFVDKDTKQKIKVLSGEKQKEQFLESLIHEDQAMPWLRTNGKITSWDCENYFRSVEFDLAAHE